MRDCKHVDVNGARRDPVADLRRRHGIHIGHAGRQREILGGDAQPMSLRTSSSLIAPTMEWPLQASTAGVRQPRNAHGSRELRR
jgi:hypothetical protein